MNRGFPIILTAQFFSSLGDNALLFAAIALLKSLDAPAWQIPVLQQFFVIAFILLAPFVGAFADALPKGQVMFISNTLKMVGCLAMLLGLHPLLAYGVVGVGAALYSPAKYGILTECLPANRLVWANSWMEGLTVAAVILGAIVGGLLIGDHLDLIHQMPVGMESLFGANAKAKVAILVLLMLYLIAALFNVFIPKLPVEHKLETRNFFSLIRDFWQSFCTLWKDPLGQISLAVTSLFWGAGTVLRFIILAWAADALSMDMERGTQLTALVAVGLALGSILAARFASLEHAVKVLPLGIVMGGVVMAMVWVHQLWVAVLMLILIGVLAGSFVIPMNALLQHRGHQLMGSGHSIAVQNCNENLSILLMLGAYSLMVKSELSSQAIVLMFGGFIALTMAVLNRKHGHDQD
ncbi:MAG: lysophospholipid transporter LplT [Methylococcaceae bacterium]|nr:lysophospholipid transporter LplT [Methylococcaceae bacterium]